MIDATVAKARADASQSARTTIEALDQALRDSGPAEALAILARRLDEQGDYRALLDARLLQARLELGLPSVQTEGLDDVPEPVRSRYEDRYVAAIREVGHKFLAKGDVPGAWPYFRAIGEPEPVAQAIEAYVPSEDDDRLSALIEVAFNQGANPRKGFEWILGHYGTCSAISAFEHLPREGATRVACAGSLVRQLHGHLLANLRAEIAHRGQPSPPEGTPIAELLPGRDWLFQDEAYHIDVSHLASTVRVSPLLTDPELIALAFDLTEYGRRLSGRHVFEGDPPFDRVYEDHGVYLRALLGRDVEDALSHFRAKLSAEAPDPTEGFDDGFGPPQKDTAPAQVLVGLLARLGRLDEAIDVASEHLAREPESTLFCPSVAQLCQRAGRPERLAQVALRNDDPVRYAAARLMSASESPPKG
ncbi:MAG: hypothetical protein AB7I30_08735 [Isosphaeraceae bacterium]